LDGSWQFVLENKERKIKIQINFGEFIWRNEGVMQKWLWKAL